MINDASLVMIPSGYKDGKLYSVKPTNGDGDFTFSRGSNLAATRVNSEGLIEKGRENLLLQSNSFDTTWSVVRATETQGATGYDGSNDAWTITPNATNDSHSISQSSWSTSSGLFTISIYAKADGYNYFTIRDSAASNNYGLFDLSQGTSRTSGTYAIDTTITAITDGWYRCQVVFNRTAGGSNNLVIYVNDTDTTIASYSGDGTSGIIFMDSQAEVGLVATEYIETTTTTAQAGILEDMPRLDYSGGSCPALLLEPQRSNLLTQSEYFDGWTKLNAPTITTNIAISPDGNLNASGIQDTDGTNFKRVSQSVSVTSNSTVTASIFVKKETNETNYGGLVLDFTGGTRNVFYIIMDSVNGVANNSTSSTSSCTISVTSFNDNWWKLVVTATDAGSNTSLAYQYFATIAVNSTGGIGIGVGSVRTIYGAMLEEASYPTSYIPTYGSSVTRSADSCSKTGISSLIGQTEGTMFIEFDFTNNSDNQVLLSAHDGAVNKRLEIWAYNNTINGFIGGSVNIAIGSTTIADGIHKAAVAYDESGNQAFYVDGVQVGTSSTTYTISALTTLAFMKFTGLLKPTEGVNQTILFKTRLSNDELAALTTL